MVGCTARGGCASIAPCNPRVSGPGQAQAGIAGARRQRDPRPQSAPSSPPLLGTAVAYPTQSHLSHPIPLIPANPTYGSCAARIVGPCTCDARDAWGSVGGRSRPWSARRNGKFTKRSQFPVTQCCITQLENHSGLRSRSERLGTMQSATALRNAGEGRSQSSTPPGTKRDSGCGTRASDALIDRRRSGDRSARKRCS